MAVKRPSLQWLQPITVHCSSDEMMGGDQKDYRMNRADGIYQLSHVYVTSFHIMTAVTGSQTVFAVVASVHRLPVFSTSVHHDVLPSAIDRLLLWNSLPVDVKSALSLTTFRQKLKTHLFRQSYPDIII